MQLEIKAIDTLFFRNGTPFKKGEETWAGSVFPPYPSVFYGALRTVYFANHLDELNRANEENDPTAKLRLEGIYYKIYGSLYFPLPFDCVSVKDSKNDKAVKLNFNRKIFPGSFNLDYVLNYGQNVENIPGGIVSESIFTMYLNGNLQECNIDKIDNYAISEYKIGIGMDKGFRSSKEGELYRLEWKRLTNMLFVLSFSGLDTSAFKERGMIKVGGEAKAAQYTKADEEIKVKPPDFSNGENRFKVVLSTPAIFKNGWIPQWLDKNTLQGIYNGVKVKLLTAAIGKPVYVGGFDIKKSLPKPMYRAVPAGSVYYFELLEGAMSGAVSAFHEKSLSDIMSEQGFGISYVGKI